MTDNKKNRLSNISDKEWDLRIEEAIKKNTNFKYFKSFLGQFSTIKKPRIELYIFQLYIRELAEEMNFDIEQLLIDFNKCLDYSLDERRIRHRLEIKKYYNVDINSLDETQVNTLTKYSYDIIYMIGQDEYDNLILRHFLYLQNSNYRLPLYINQRKISALDFNELCYKRLDIDTLCKAIESKYISYDKQAYETLLYKIERQDKLYIINMIDSDKVNKDYFKDNLSNIIINFDLIGEIETYKKRFSNVYFNTISNRLIQEIKEELELIHFIIELNTFILQSRWNDSYSLFDNIKKGLTTRQNCLLLQIFSSTLDNTISVRFTNSNHFVLLANSIIDYCKNICKSKPLNPCDHDTFHYYTLNKWILLFKHILVREGLPTNLEPYEINNLKEMILFPKDAFCTKCHDYYKEELQKTTVDISELNKLPVEVKYVIFQHKNKIPFYRIKYSDLCQTTPGHNPHFLEYINSKQNANEFQTMVFKALTEELFVYRNRYL